jgi:hypothetical protein
MAGKIRLIEILLVIEAVCWLAAAFQLHKMHEASTQQKLLATTIFNYCTLGQAT